MNIRISKNNNLIPAIVLSTHTIGLGVIRSLGKMNVPIIAVFYERKDMGYFSKYVNEKIFVPHPEKNEQQFLKVLIELSRRFNKAILIPADDVTLMVVSKNKHLLEPHFILTFPDWSVIQKLLDKKHTYILAEQLKIPMPKTYYINTVEELKNQLEKVFFPVLLKPSVSHHFFELYNKKMELAYNPDQCIDIFNKNSIDNVEMMLQEIIPGDDTNGMNYNSYFWDSNPIVEFCAQKIRYNQAGYGIPIVVKSCGISKEIASHSHQLLKSVGFNGYSCIEFKLDSRDGKYKFMEINGRFNRSILLSLYCDINFPWIMYQHHVSSIISEPKSYEYNIYWIDEFQDINNFLRSKSKRKYSILDFLRPYFGKHIFAVFDIKDPFPFLKRIIDSFKLILRIFRISN